MMEIDVIILSYTKDESIHKMTNECIDSINNSTTAHTFNIILVETDKSGTFPYTQDNVTTIVPEEDFNYNKFLNIGLKECKNEWILISNNDTVYHNGWLEKMLESHDIDNEILSMSPFDDIWHIHNTFDKATPIHYGHRVSYEITGWSILMNKKVLEIIGDFDEDFKFWYQDNDYAQNLLKHKIIHALITDSKVTHLLSRSHGLIDNNERHNMTNGLNSVFINKWVNKK